LQFIIEYLLKSAI